MSQISHHHFITALRDWGVDVVLHDYQGKPWHEHTSAGSFNPHGVLHHHTAGPKKLLHDRATQVAMRRILQHGRTGLPGPLAHLGLAWQPWNGRAVAHAVGWGNANHAGLGDSRVMAQIVADTYKGLRGTAEDHDGNPDLYGLEYMHPGDDTPWPDELIELGVLCGAAICDAHGWKASSNLEHFEWTDRKEDRSAARLHPHRYDIREAVGARLAAGPNGDDMAAAADIAKAVLGATIKSLTDGKDRTLAQLVAYTHKHASEANAGVAVLQDQVRAIAERVDIDPAELDAIEQRVKAALSESVVDVAVNVNDKTGEAAQ